ncbi:MAG: hypothetical protein IJS37_00965 [Bacilli bacterium]|nr:hypothetical protein [Bacilli bacterium]
MKSLSAECFCIAIRARKEGRPLFPLNPEDRFDFHRVKVPRGKWGADPFLFEKDGQAYLFAELFNLFTGKGALYVRSIGNEHAKWKRCNIEKCHLSFPNVFMQGGETLMMPETSELRQVNVYQATKFPERWMKCETRLANVNAVDSVVLFESGSIASYVRNSRQDASLTAFDSNGTQLWSLQDKDKKLRPAGNPFFDGGLAYFIGQNCQSSYGEGLCVYLLDQTKGIQGMAIREIGSEGLDYLTPRSHSIGIHTYNKSEHYEVIDIKFRKFSLLRILGKPFRVLFRTRRTR